MGRIRYARPCGRWHGGFPLSCCMRLLSIGFLSSMGCVCWREGEGGRQRCGRSDSRRPLVSRKADRGMQLMGTLNSFYAEEAIADCLVFIKQSSVLIAADGAVAKGWRCVHVAKGDRLWYDLPSVRRNATSKSPVLGSVARVCQLLFNLFEVGEQELYHDLVLIIYFQRKFVSVLGVFKNLQHRQDVQRKTNAYSKEDTSCDWKVCCQGKLYIILMVFWEDL